MAESPKGYFPDVFPGSEQNIVPSDNTVTDILIGANLRQVRRGWGPSNGLRQWTYPTSALSQADSLRVRQFLVDRRGELDAFYFWTPGTRQREDFACGAVAAASTFILPLRITNPIGGAVGSLTDVRVAGVSQVFTRRALLPRSGTYATLVFNSTSQYVDCGSNSTLRPTGNMSGGGWVNVKATSGGGQNWIFENETANASGIMFGFSATQLILRTNQAGAQVNGLVTYTVPLDTWVHLFFVRNGTNVTFYVNGVAVGTAAGVSNPVAATRSFRISSNAATVGINGRMNEVRFYDTNISVGEVLNIYNGVATASANLKGWWRLTEGTGATATDLSGYANTGTLTGSPVWVAGEEEITFAGGAQTGAVTAWGLIRERVVVRYLGASRRLHFLGTTPLTSFDLSFVELY